jgi:coniferyl-aldehyde dehydrogenase
MNDQNTIAGMRDRLNSQRKAFAQSPTPTLQQRYDWLDRIIDMTARNQSRIVEAASADFGGRAAAETTLVEVFGTTANARNTRRRLKHWMKARKVPTALPFRPGYNRLVSQPLGVVGVISPWNLAYNLSMGPAIAAFSAGNRVMLKPSELTPASASLIQSIVKENFDADEFDVFPGGPEVAAGFSALPFDHLLYTGSTGVGRKVAEAAARNLTPVTLELGGKSPVIVDKSADITRAAARLAFAKQFNGGQICVSPDYVLVPANLRDQLVEGIVEASRKLYPADRADQDYCSIVSEHHHQRLQGLLDEARRSQTNIVQAWPAASATGRRVPLSLLVDPDPQLEIMKEEIFGPLLPVISYTERQEAIDYVNARPRPLALYWFGRDKVSRSEVLAETISGSVAINDCIWQFAQEDQPFGGIGPSGMGAYHGETGFRTFSKEKPIYYAPRWPYSAAMLQPPYSEKTMKLLEIMRRFA